MEVRVLSSALIFMSATLFLLCILFILISKSADVVIVGVRELAEKLRVNIFLAGLLLGVFTSLPEITIGLNALFEGIPDIAFGNMVGGTVVLFGLVLGLSSVLNRRIQTDGLFRSILPITLYLLLPLFYGLDGRISALDGAILIFGYLIVLGYTYSIHSRKSKALPHTPRNYAVSAELLTILLGLIGVFLSANLIVRNTELVLEAYHLPAFMVGLIVFSLGTNLPEVVVTIRSWRRNIKDLSLSNLFGSALTNGLTIGVLALMSPISIMRDNAYFALFAGTALLMGALSLFYQSGKEFTRAEGVVLIVIYLGIAVGTLTLAVY